MLPRVRIDGGLSEAEVVARRTRAGRNVVPTAPVRRWGVITAQLTHLMALLLWAGGLVAWLAGLAPLAVAIWLVNLVNGGFAAWQEWRADRAAAALRALVPRRARVVRGGAEVVVPVEDLVPDDLIVLAEGDRVGADARLIEATGLATTEAALTGESVPVDKAVDGDDQVLAGTIVVRGVGRAVVTATGAASRIGAIARATLDVREPWSPLQRQLRRATRTITTIAVAVGAGFLALALVATELDRASAFVLALGMVVAFVPEGLLPTVTVALAGSARRMAARNALVRRLSAVEALGAASVICCDKTGTLTVGAMEVVELDDGGVPARARRVMARCHDLPDGPGADPTVGDPTERALVAAARAAGPATDAPPRVGELPFDSARRRMTTLHRDGGHEVALAKGAPEEMLAHCRWWLDGGARRPLDADARAHLQRRFEAMAARGLRVLALADRSGAPAPAGHEEDDLELVGLVGLRDPPRPEVAGAIARCRRAGVRVLMLTGDHPLAAAAIARELGLADAAARVLTGADLDALDDEALGAALAGPVVLARLRPEHKLRVTTCLQARGEVVAMTGDGTNDAPALRQADVGVAMGRAGTDLAREVADVILLDDDFGTIVAAIEEGRAVHANITRFTSYIFTSNVPEAVPFLAFALSGGHFPLALGVMHVLAIDLGTDLAPALALGAEPPAPGTMDAPPRARDAPLVGRALLVRAYLWLGLLQAAVVMAAFVLYFRAHGYAGWLDLPATGPVHRGATSMALAAVVMTQLGNLVVHRAPRGPGPRPRNRLLGPAVAIELGLLLALIYLPPLQRVIGTGPLPAWAWPPLIASAPVLLLVDRAARRLRAGGSRPRAHAHGLREVAADGAGVEVAAPSDQPWRPAGREPSSSSPR